MSLLLFQELLIVCFVSQDMFKKVPNGLWLELLILLDYKVNSLDLFAKMFHTHLTDSHHECLGRKNDFFWHIMAFCCDGKKRNSCLIYQYAMIYCSFVKLQLGCTFVILMFNFINRTIILHYSQFEIICQKNTSVFSITSFF